AAATEMLSQPHLHVRVDGFESATRIPKLKVACPASQVLIHLPDQSRDRLPAPTSVRQRSGPLPFSGQRFLRGNHVQVAMPVTEPIPVVPKRESQKVQTRSFLLQVQHPRLLPIDCQPH